ncbi:MAG: hypothetical protein ACT4P9_07890 [Betaproteobacteria bacterium]
MPPHLSLKARLGYGCALPLALLVAWQFLLAAYIGGLGGFGGMLAVIASFVVVPAAAVLNLWVLAPRWLSPWGAFCAGLALPVVAGVAELLVFQGMVRNSRWVEQAAGQPAVVLLLASFALPLVASIVFALLRRRRERVLPTPAEN